MATNVTKKIRITSYYNIDRKIQACKCFDKYKI